MPLAAGKAIDYLHLLVEGVQFAALNDSLAFTAIQSLACSKWLASDAER
jgi:hypothetical protein